MDRASGSLRSKKSRESRRQNSMELRSRLCWVKDKTLDRPHSEMTHFFIYSMSASWNLKLEMKRRHSSRPAKTVNSPLKGFFLNRRSNAADLSCVPFFQYAYAMVIWYVSINSAVVSEL